MWQDLIYATRSLRRTPVFTLSAIVTLSVGIGANTAIFSLMNSVLLRTLPLTAPDELYFVAHGVSDGEVSTISNFPWLERVRAMTDVFAGVTAYNIREFKVSSSEGAQRVDGQYVSGNYHAVAGVPMALGRGFTTEDDRAPGSSPLAVISDTFWSRRFNRDPQVVGQTLNVGGKLVTIVGVTSRGFEGMQPGRPVEITLPLSMRVADEPTFLTSLDSWTSMPILVRLKPGVDVRQAQAAVRTAFRTHVSQPGIGFGRSRTGDVRSALLQAAGKGQDRLRTTYRAPLTILMWMVGAVLLVACVNIANLLLVRGASRAREIAVRMSVGASRARLVRQFLAESLVLSCAGGAIGVLAAGWGTQFVSRLFIENQNPIVIDAQPDLMVVLFASGVSLLTGIVAGSIPALRATHVDVTPALRQSATTLAGRGGLTGRKSLVAVQIALSMVLVFAAALLVRTQQRVQGIDGGFTTDNVLVFSLDARDTTFPMTRMTALCGDTLARLRPRAGVVAASCSTMSPVDTAFEGRVLGLPKGPPAPGNEVFANTVTPEYFQTFGIGLVHGRLFTAQDTATSTRVAIINEAAARRFFGTDDPVGQTIAFGSRPDPARGLVVVGVVRDARQTLRDAPPRMVYQPLDQSVDPPESLIAAIHTTDDPAPLAGMIRSEVRALTPDVAVMWVRTMRQQIAAATTRERLLATLSTTFAVLALLLACVGLYGVISYDVARRTRDIGVRLALGAERSTVLAAVVRQTVAIVAVGLPAGLVAAFMTSGIVSGLLFELTPLDPVSLTVATASLGISALVAGYIPAYRASRIDPAVALRSE